MTRVHAQCGGGVRHVADVLGTLVAAVLCKRPARGVGGSKTSSEAVGGRVSRGGGCWRRGCRRGEPGPALSRASIAAASSPIW